MIGLTPHIVIVVIEKGKTAKNLLNKKASAIYIPTSGTATLTLRFV